jgi:hypothetical protein
MTVFRYQHQAGHHLYIFSGCCWERSLHSMKLLAAWPPASCCSTPCQPLR